MKIFCNFGCFSLIYDIFRHKMEKGNSWHVYLGRHRRYDALELKEKVIYLILLF